MKRSLLVALLSVMTVAAGAQKHEFSRNAIDIGMGATFSYIDMPEYMGKKAFATGADFGLRYSRYFTKEWGAFLQGEIKGNSSPSALYFSKLETLENNQYTYEGFKTGPESPGRLFYGIFAGGVYKYDIGRWSFIPRVGLGVTEYHSKNNRYYRIPANGEENKRQAVIIGRYDGEYVSSDSQVLPAIKAGMQFKYAVGEHFNIGADLDLTMFMSNYECAVRTYNTSYDPVIKDIASVIINMLLFMIPSAVIEDYKTTDLVSEIHSHKRIPPVTSVQFSIGWDF